MTESGQAWLARAGAILCGVFLYGCQRDAGDVVSAPSLSDLPVIRAEVIELESSIWPSVVRTQGTLGPDEVALIGTKVAGRVAQVHVDLGDVVRAGDPLASLDEEESRLQVLAAEAQLAEARAAIGLRPEDSADELEREEAALVRQEKALWDESVENLRRARDLRARNAISEAEVERLDAAERVAAARYISSLNGVDEKIALVAVRTAALELARQRLREAVIRTPFEGRIQQRHVAPGEYVPVGHTIATVVRSNPLRYRGTIPERHAQQLTLGQSVSLRIESISEPRVVKVSRISPVLDELSRALLFEALVDNSDGRLRTGLFAEGEVVLDSLARSLVVPSSAVIEFAGAEKVWKVVEGVVREQEVRTGTRRGERIEIIGGLNAGDRILRDGAAGRAARIEPIQVELTNESGVAGTRGDTNVRDHGTDHTETLSQ